MTDADSQQAPSNDKKANDNLFDGKHFCQHLPNKPGVYQMYGAEGQLLYVGKAKALKKRVNSYFRGTGLSGKTQALVNKITHIEVAVTETEGEALLLEQNLIKSERPTYNILLRDDKSYPYIYFSLKDKWPRLALHRGGKTGSGKYYGPYPNVSAVRETLSLLQKIFLVRQCDDSFFRHRSRPCLQHQINRCSAPCVNKVTAEEYQQSVKNTMLFLDGKSDVLHKDLTQRMQQASENLEFEKAAELRDAIGMLRQVQGSQSVEGTRIHADVIACAVKAGKACIHALFVRDGRVIGSRSYYVRFNLEETMSEVLNSFIAQHYLTSTTDTIPKEIITSTEVSDAQSIEAALTLKTGRGVRLTAKVKSDRSRWVKLAQSTAEQNLASHLNNHMQITERYQALQDALQLPETPERMECFDISHSSGELAVASCVVFNSNGPVTSDYRRFNIEGITPGDDYAAIEQAVRRRYTRLKKGEGKLPDILFIDGGKGQVNKAKAVLEELQVTGVTLLGVAKGSDRKAGQERIIFADTLNEIMLSNDSIALHLIQHIRDEAHRFAVSGHSARRGKQRIKSELDTIDGIGAKRKKALLQHFGGLQGIKQASREDLQKTQGISPQLAETIYQFFHGE